MEKKDDQHPESTNAFMLCILSHGGDGFILGVDGEKITIDEIVSKFDGDNCPALSGKPKVFIIQACRKRKS